MAQKNGYTSTHTTAGISLRTNPVKARGKKGQAQKKSARVVMQQKHTKLVSEAVNLRMGGYNYEEIGRVQGISKTAAYRRVQKGLLECTASLEKDSSSLRSLELERLEAMFRSLWGQAQTGDVDAIDRCMRISAQRTRLLGLDINQVELTFDDQALAILAEIIARRVDPSTAALIKADFASYATLQSGSAPAMLPAPNITVEEGDFHAEE